MESTSLLPTFTSPELKTNEKPTAKHKASRRTVKEALSVEDTEEESPNAIDIRITKRRGGVRLSLSNMKAVRKSDNPDQISYVRSPYPTHLTKEQFKTLMKLAPKLYTELNAVEITQQMKARINRPQQIFPLQKPVSGVSSLPRPLKISPTTVPTRVRKTHQAKNPVGSVPQPTPKKIHPRQTILLEHPLPLKPQRRQQPSKRKRKQPTTVSETLEQKTSQAVAPELVIGGNKRPKSV